MNTISNPLSPDTQKVAGGSLILGGAAATAVSLLAAKSIIVIGFAANVIPIVGTIIGIVMMIFGALTFYHAFQRDRTGHSLAEKNLEPITVRLPTVEREKAVPEVELETLPPPLLEKEEPIEVVSEEVPEQPVTETAKVDPLDFTNQDKLLTNSNLIQWTLIGLGFSGLAPSILMPLSVLASLGSEVATFCSLPKDASWLRKAMSIPLLSKAIISYNPWIARLFQVTSLCNLVQTSVTKLGAAWEGFKTDPVKAKKAGAVHLFNLASGVIFAADSAGILRRSQQDQPCNPETEEGCYQTKNKGVKLATVYNNEGNEKHERDQISALVVQNHREYARKHGLEHDVITHDLVAGKCANPFTKQDVNCSPYMNKIAYFRNQCADPAQRGKLVIYGDDDLVYTNMNIDPLDAFNRLRNGKNTSVVMAREGADWAKWFPIPGHKTHDPRVAVNTGFIMARIDDATCDLMERTWQHRNDPMDASHGNYQKCPTIAFCQDHGITSLGDQTAMAAALQDDLSVIDRTVTIVLPRDLSATHRAHIAFNTLNRDGCREHGGEYFDIGDHDRANYPDGMWRPGDWNGQTAGYRVMGRLGKLEKGVCVEDPNRPHPINLRLAKIKEMLLTKPEKAVTIGIAHLRDGNPEESQYSHLTYDNHREYAKRHKLKFFHVTDKNLIKDRCTHPVSNEPESCSPYMMKVQAARLWLSQPNTSGKEEWLCIADDDGVYGDMELKPSKVIENLQGSSDASIIIANDIQTDASAVNTGLIFIRKDDASRRFIDKWWTERNTATADPTHPTCHTHGSCENQIISLNDQSCFENAMRNHPRFINDGIIKIVPHRSPTRTYGINTINRVGCFIRDQDKWKTDKPTDYRSDDLRSNPQGIAQKGDFYFQAAGVPRMGRYCDEPSDTPSHPIRKDFVLKMLDLVQYPKRPSNDVVVSAKLTGGLGNQLFQISTAHAFAKDLGGKAIFPKTDVEHVTVSPVLSRVQRFDGAPPDFPLFYEQTDFQELQDQPHSVYLSGYYQTFKKFDHHRRELVDLFRPTSEVESYLNTKYKGVLNQDTVAIHVRRGDYLHFTHEGVNICENLSQSDYYEKAISRFDPENQHFVVFTNNNKDDINFVKNMPAFQKLKHVTFVEGNKDHEDFYLMTKCKNFILANSTFSSWAAYLAENIYKKVIYPVNFFTKELASRYHHNSQKHSISDDNWIPIESK